MDGWRPELVIFQSFSYRPCNAGENNIAKALHQQPGCPASGQHHPHILRLAHRFRSPNWLAHANDLPLLRGRIRKPQHRQDSFDRVRPVPLSRHNTECDPLPIPSRQPSRWPAHLHRGCPRAQVSGTRYGLAIASAEAGPRQGAMERWHRPLMRAAEMSNHKPNHTLYDAILPTRKHIILHTRTHTLDTPYPGRGRPKLQIRRPPLPLRRDSTYPRCCCRPRPPNRRPYTRYTSWETTSDRGSSPMRCPACTIPSRCWGGSGVRRRRRHRLRRRRQGIATSTSPGTATSAGCGSSTCP